MNWTAVTETVRFDANSSSEIAQKSRSLRVKLAIEQDKILGEYSSFLKPSTWNYLLLEVINLHRSELYWNDFVSKRPVTAVT